MRRLLTLAAFSLAPLFIVSCGNDDGGGSANNPPPDNQPQASPTPGGSGGGSMTYLCNSDMGVMFQLRVEGVDKIVVIDGQSETPFNRTMESTAEHYTFRARQDDIMRDLQIPKPMVDDSPATTRAIIKEGTTSYECNREDVLQ